MVEYLQIGLTAIAIGFLVVMVFLVFGQADYEDARRLECAESDKAYNSYKDTCIDLDPQPAVDVRL